MAASANHESTGSRRSTELAYTTVPGLTIPMRVESTVVTTQIKQNRDGSYQTYINGKPVGQKMV